jgi:aldose 1-epimerase
MVYSPQTGRALTVITPDPGIQFYTGNFLGDGKGGVDAEGFFQRQALCLEPQRLPNAMNENYFGQYRLDPHFPYDKTDHYLFSVGEPFAELRPVPLAFIK